MKVVESHDNVVNECFKGGRWSDEGMENEYKTFMMKHCAVILTHRSWLAQCDTCYICRSVCYSSPSVYVHVYVCTVDREPLNIKHYFQNCAHLFIKELLMKPTPYWGCELCLSLNLRLVLPGEDPPTVIYNNTLHSKLNRCQETLQYREVKKVCTYSDNSLSTMALYSTRQNLVHLNSGGKTGQLGEWNFCKPETNLYSWPKPAQYAW